MAQFVEFFSNHLGLSAMWVISLGAIVFYHQRTGSQGVGSQQLVMLINRKGAVVVDVAIDQGGCFETSKATTHQDPIYDVDGIMHYCVANMPGAVARTSTIALGNATMPFMLALADKGWKQACEDDEHLLNGLNVHAGQLTYFAVGKALGIDVLSPQLALRS